MGPTKEQQPLLNPIKFWLQCTTVEILLLLTICQLSTTFVAYGQGTKGGSAGSSISFNQFSPAQYKQIISQQSTSQNSQLPQSATSTSFNEEISSSGGLTPSGGSSTLIQNTRNIGGKASGFRSERRQLSVVSPIQHANSIKNFNQISRRQQFSAPTISTFVESSKQVSSQQPQTIQNTKSEQIFQLMRSFMNSLTPTQLHSIIQTIQQQQQPIITIQPGSESSFKRVVNIQSGIQPSVPITQQQESIRQQQLQQSGGVFDGLIQEKVDSTSSFDSSNGISQTAFAFDGSDIQQKNIVPDDHSGVPEASINKWYIMKPMRGSQVLASQGFSNNNADQQAANLRTVLPSGSATIATDIDSTSSRDITSVSPIASTTSAPLSRGNASNGTSRNKKKKKKTVSSTTAAPMPDSEDGSDKEEKA